MAKPVRKVVTLDEAFHYVRVGKWLVYQRTLAK